MVPIRSVDVQLQLLCYGFFFFKSTKLLSFKSTKHEGYVLLDLKIVRSSHEINLRNHLSKNLQTKISVPHMRNMSQKDKETRGSCKSLPFLHKREQFVVMIAEGNRKKERNEGTRGGTPDEIE